MTKIIVPILERSPQRVIQSASRFATADGFEIWLDELNPQFWTEHAVEKLFKSLKQRIKKKAFVAVCKQTNEGGSFPADHRRKIGLLLAAIRGGADYIDVIWTCPPNLFDRLVKNKGNAKLIVSYHHFSGTPRITELRKIPSLIMLDGADIVKIATFAQTKTDANRLMRLALELKKIPHIVIGMGEEGIITRVFSHELGNELTFVAGEKKTAEGQMTLEETERIVKLLNC